ncbi:Dps family protein [Sunxiuqinia sp. A32]|uniref:Dps family protein n=1 Tax=Sunxiuqinia sp. A32 TaxID=3461496 RepID=UPI004045E945
METLEKTQVKNFEIVTGLNDLLADLQVHYQNLRGLHWNVKGTMFFVLHSKFEEYYNHTAEVVDEVAERILMVGGQPVHTFSDYLSNASIKEVKNVSDGIHAVSLVLDQTNTLLKRMKAILDVASDENDEGTNAMLSNFISEYEKRTWMLQTFLS